MGLLANIRTWARRIRREAVTLWFACRDPATPWLVKLLCGLVVAYALSPIDLIPDFIPVLGYLDDALLLPALIWLALRLLPEAVRRSAAQRADAWLATQQRRLRSWLGAVLILLVWLLLLALAWRAWGSQLRWPW